MDYKKAGVDIEAGYKSVELMKKHRRVLIMTLLLVYMFLEESPLAKW